MFKAFLLRLRETDQGTEGVFIIGDKFFYSLELPYRDNYPKLSCIPVGVYVCVPHTSQKYKNVYRVLDVPNRVGILIHHGNYAGDIKKGYKSHVEGCILLGKSLGYLNGQRAVLSSRVAIQELWGYVGNNNFNLEIYYV